MRPPVSTTRADSAAAELIGPLTQRLHRVFYCLDERDYDSLVAAFADDGVWNRQGERLQGHAAVRRALDARSPTQRIRHVISNTFVAEVEGDEATVVAYMTAYRHDDGTPSAAPPRIAGPLRISKVAARFRRVGDDWLIAEQTLTPEFEFGSG